MNTFYFHIGLPKTGSTFVQKILQDDDRINLSRSSIHKFNFNSHELKLIENKVNIDSNETYLVKGENAKKYNMMLTLSKIRNSFEHVKIIVTLRKPDNALKSMFKYRIKHGGYFNSFDDWFLKDEAQDYFSVLHYATLNNALTAFFKEDDIHYLFYEDLRDNYLMIEEFYEILGLSKPENISKSIVNKGLSDFELQKMNYLNKYLKSNTLKKRIFKKIPFFKKNIEPDFFKSKYSNQILNLIDHEMNCFYEISNQKIKNKLRKHDYLKIK
jgi:hypothetical protein